MADRITRTTQQGFFSRIANSFIGIIVGICMVPGSVLLISWNEYRTVHRSRGLAEGEKVVVEVADAFEVMPALNDRLVHVTGTATTEQDLSDPDFGVSQKAMRMERQVEMFQWVEHKESKTRDKLGGGRETVTTYKYDRKWHEGRVNSESFEERSGHENPQLRYSGHSQVTSRATLGAFRLSSSLVERKMNSWRNVPLDQADLLAKMNEAEQRHYKINGEHLYYSVALPPADTPQLGDARYKFRVVEPAVVSVLSRQQPEELVPFKTSNGEVIEHLELGNVSAVDMFNALKFENTMMAWLVRIGGWILCCVGFSLIAAPIRSIAGIVPILGNLVGTATALVAFMLGSSVTLIAIALAWIAVRPVFAIGLLLIAGGAIYLLTRRGKSANSVLPTALGPPPVPPRLPNSN
jgi:Transmembrane protein 43